MTLVNTRKYPLHGQILAPPEGLGAPELPGINSGGRPRESVVPRRFKQKKIVTHERTNGRTNGQTHCKYFCCIQYSLWQCYVSHCSLAVHKAADDCTQPMTVLNLEYSHKK